MPKVTPSKKQTMTACPVPARPVSKPGAVGAVTWKPVRRATSPVPRPGELLEALERIFPHARIELVFRDALQLLVATILSAQSTDKRVNMVTPELFRKYPAACDYANAVPGQFEREIHSTGFYRAKTRSILGAARMLVERFGGEVPCTMDELVQLPGVARKTANVVLWGAFGKNEGVAVDTHVIRVSQRLGLTRCAEPEKIEQDLMRLLPREKWGRATELLIFLGRYMCKAGIPDCPACGLHQVCPSSWA